MSDRQTGRQVHRQTCRQTHRKTDAQTTATHLVPFPWDVVAVNIRNVNKQVFRRGAITKKVRNHICIMYLDFKWILTFTNVIYTNTHSHYMNLQVFLMSRKCIIRACWKIKISTIGLKRQWIVSFIRLKALLIYASHISQHLNIYANDNHYRISRRIVLCHHLLPWPVVSTIHFLTTNFRLVLAGREKQNIENLKKKLPEFNWIMKM